MNISNLLNAFALEAVLLANHAFFARPALVLALIHVDYIEHLKVVVVLRLDGMVEFLLQVLANLLVGLFVIVRDVLHLPLKFSLLVLNLLDLLMSSLDVLRDSVILLQHFLKDVSAAFSVQSFEGGVREALVARHGIDNLLTAHVVYLELQALLHEVVDLGRLALYPLLLQMGVALCANGHNVGVHIRVDDFPEPGCDTHDASEAGHLLLIHERTLLLLALRLLPFHHH